MRIPALALSVSLLMSANAICKTEEAVFGGGCFWCVEAVFENVPGVESVTSGYAGGTVPNPTYDQVCGGRTGHAEVVRIAFDPTVVTFRDLVDLFWMAHDPTTKNRQVADVGTQYRSIILYSNDRQKADAEASRAAAQSAFRSPIVTEIAPLGDFYPAEAYHQDFYRLNPSHPYNRAVIAPKLEKLAKDSASTPDTAEKK